MEKVYRLLDWLTFENALDWLRTLTETQIGDGELWRLVMSEQCDAYIQALGLHGHYINDDGHEIEVIGRGFQLVVGSETIRKADKKNGTPEKRRLSLEGARYEPDPRNNEIAIRSGHDYWEAVTAEVDGYPLYFKPADIEALATKMNGAKEPPNTAELEDLRTQLDKAKHLAFSSEHYKNEALKSEQQVRQQLDQLTASRLSDSRTVKTLSQELEQERRARADAVAVTVDLNQQLERARELYKADWIRINTSEDMVAKLSISLALANRDLVQLGQKLEQEQAIRIAAEQQLRTEDKSIPKPSHYLAIAAMLGLLKDAGRSSRNQSAVLAEILERNPNKHGISKRTLESIFSDANKAMAGDE
jgi:hypothetical protein